MTVPARPSLGHGLGTGKAAAPAVDDSLNVRVHGDGTNDELRDGGASDDRVPVGGCGCIPEPGMGCVAQLTAPQNRLTAMRAAIADEADALVTLTHLLRLCRDEHPVLWESAEDMSCRTRVSCVLAELSASMPAPGIASSIGPAVRAALAAALAPSMTPRRW